MKQPDDIYRKFAEMVLPADMLTYFDVVGFEETQSTKEIHHAYSAKDMHIYLDEKPVPPGDSVKYKPNGFTEESTMFDFPIRDRKVILHVRRRRWLDDSGHNCVLDYGELLGAKGTRYSRELADFLKGID